MPARGLTPILNVSDIEQSFAWFEKLGWEKGWDWGSPATLPPTDMPWNVREMHVRHPGGHVFRISRGLGEAL
jgi:hypothetical protein